MSSQICSHIGYYGKDGNHIQDLFPGTNAVGFRCYRSAELSGQLPCVHAHLQNIIYQSQQRSQWKGGHEQCDKTKLDH